MGLAYRLDTTANPYVTQGLSNYFVNFPAQQVASKVSSGGDPNTGCSFFDQLQTDKGRPNGWEFRWCGKKGTSKQSCQGIFPTGEFCIRDITFVNGYYAIVGSYKATFLDLYGAGSHGLAWDGFLMMYRGFSDNFAVPFGEDGLVPNDFVSSTGIGILPMRMPYDILPSSNSATTEAMDDVGLYTVDVWRGSPTITAVPQPGGGDPFEAFNIQLWLGGTQGVSDPVAQGMTYTNIDRIAFGMVGVFGTVTYPEVQGGVLTREQSTEYYLDFNIDPNSEPPLGTSLPSYALKGSRASITTFDTRANQTIKFAWKATANDTMYQGPAAGTCILWRTCDMDVQMSISGQERGGNGGAYNFQIYEDGWLPNGTNQCTGDTSADDTTATTWNYYPRRFMDVQAYSAETTKIAGVSQIAFTPCMFAGDMWVGTDDPTVASPSAKVFPAGYAMCLEPLRVNIDDFCNPGGVCFLNPFMQGFTAQVSFKGAGAGATNPTIIVQDTVKACIKTSGGALNFDSLANSYFAFATLAYEEVGTDYDAASFNPSQRPPLRYFWCNAIKYTDNTIGCGIFRYEESPLENDLSVFGFAFNGQRLSSASDTLIPIEMPNKWTAKISQTRTFTTQEENNAKSLFESPGGLFVNDEQVFNSRNGEAVGVRNNYPRLGVEPVNEFDYDPTLNALAQQGAKTQEAQGCMGYKSTTIPADPSSNGEPIVVVFDSGGGWFRDSFFPVTSPNYANPPTYSNSLQNRGATFNSNILVDKDSTNRVALGCSWDNDRDQWIFLFGNYSGVAENQQSSLVSVTSTFTNSARYGSAYLDQTGNFNNSPSAFNNIIWKSFPMTNNLDGIVIFGQTNSGSTNMQNPGSIAYTTANINAKTDRPQEVWARNSGTGTRAFPTQTGSCEDASDPATIQYTPSSINWYNLDGSTGREAFVWVDYILFDGADAVIATKLRERGMKVSIDAVEWFKRKIINSGDLNIKAEEIEMWMRQQQDEFSMMMRDAERQGRVRKKKKQVSAYGLTMLDSINTDFEDKEIQEFMQDYLPKSRPPTPEEEMIERQRKGGYSPQAKSYFDEVFEQ
tara:strand:+ start:1480 stop:4689 length:3210 start_codon:yes stop_codon:yes gene_type:complete